ncbi:hypothetical protein TELCIR_07937 [Teladorsagia circumcincta]|uniref:CNH domain-containing protein n=1 Tax=Teladorsagia circumcincta TaxID=45464 RepID=A0A2G9UJ07_TELCI|nr:hypothetical protein TELCIR_07937 [Teladorsagia circumcincta]
MYEAYTPNEVAVKLPLEITSLTCQKSCGSVYAGSKVGQLFVYTPKRTNRRGFDLDTLCKQFERKAVLDLSICEEQDLVFCVSDGQLAAHYLKDRHFPVVSILHKIKPVNGFVTWIPEDSDTVYIFVSSKKRIFLFKWFEKDFQDVRFDYNQSFPDKPNTMRVVGNTLVLSCGRDYILVKLTKSTNEDGESWTGDCRRLFDVSDNPSIILMRDRDLLGFLHGDTLILTNFEGQKTPLADVRFSEVPCDIDVITIIQMFPEFLPEKLRSNAAAFDLPANDKKRALLALGNYLSAVRSDLSKQLDQYSKDRHHSHPNVNPDHLKSLHISLQVVDTALLKCYLQTRPSLVDSLLRLHNNSCFFEDAETILLNENRLPSLFILYESRKKHEMALELLHKQFLDPDADPFFHDLDRTVGYLQTLGNTHLELIFKYARWVLDKDIASGLEIFIGEESDVARNLDRQAVLAFLRSHCVAAVIPYLEHIIYKWDETRPKFHDTLVEHYIINLKLLQQDYEHAFPDAFYEERALVLGRLKHHEQALAIYTSILNDFDAAEEYCKLYYDESDEINSQVYLQLFRAFVSPSDPMIAGVLEKDLPTPEPDILDAIRLALRRSVCACGLESHEARLRNILSQRIVVGNSSECSKCGKRIGNSAFVRYPTDGSLAHFGCHNDSSEKNSLSTKLERSVQK